MTTKRELIAAAFGELGLASYAFDTSPERMTSALGRLNRLAAQWESMGIRVGYAMGDDVDAESGIPDTAQDAFITTLALRTAPSVGKTSDRLIELKIAARTALNALLAATAKRPEVPYPSMLPVGTGNRGAGRMQQYFPETDEIPGLDDGATEY